MIFTVKNACLRIFLWLLVLVSLTGKVFALIPATRHPVASEAVQSTGLTRRSWLSTGAATSAYLLNLGPLPAFAATSTEKLVTFEDPDCGFKIDVPATWEKQEQTLPDRRKIVFFMDPSGDKDNTLLFLAYTPIRDDFTSLSSFGSVDDVAQATILPKGSIAGEDNESSMISAESKKQGYFFDYKATAGGKPETHFRTIFSFAQGATGGAGNVLVTITAQTPEARYGEMKGLFDTVIGSYGKL